MTTTPTPSGRAGGRGVPPLRGAAHSPRTRGAVGPRRSASSKVSMARLSGTTAVGQRACGAMPLSTKSRPPSSNITTRSFSSPRSLAPSAGASKAGPKANDRGSRRWSANRCRRHWRSSHSLRCRCRERDARRRNDGRLVAGRGREAAERTRSRDRCGLPGVGCRHQPAGRVNVHSTSGRQCWMRTTSKASALVAGVSKPSIGRSGSSRLMTRNRSRVQLGTAARRVARDPSLRACAPCSRTRYAPRGARRAPTRQVLRQQAE